MKLKLAALAAVMAATAAMPAAAQTVAERADARCLLIMNRISADPKQQQEGRAAIYYYLGSLHARGADGRLKSLLAAEAKTMKPAELQNELTRCGAELNASAKLAQNTWTQLKQETDAAIAASKPATPPKK